MNKHETGIFALRVGQILKLKAGCHFIDQKEITKETRGIYFGVGSIFTILEIDPIDITSYLFDIVGPNCCIWLYGADRKWCHQIFDEEFNHYWEIIS